MNTRRCKHDSTYCFVQIFLRIEKLCFIINEIGKQNFGFFIHKFAEMNENTISDSPESTPPEPESVQGIEKITEVQTPRRTRANDNGNKQIIGVETIKNTETEGNLNSMYLNLQKIKSFL